MPADKYNFAPTQGDYQGVRTFADQVKHLTEANYGFFLSWNVPGVIKRDEIEKLTSKDDLVKALKDSYVYAHKAVDTLTPANYLEPSGFGPIKTTRAGVAAFSVAHSMDHYGQMVEYLRMNGIVPPASRIPMHSNVAGRPQIKHSASARFFGLETMRRRKYPKAELLYRARRR